MAIIRRIYIVLISLCFVFVANSQHNSNESSGTNEVSPIVNNKLLNQAKRGNIDSILALGNSKDSSLIPILEMNLEKARSNNVSSVVIRAYRKALSKLGDSKSRGELLSDLDKNKTYSQMNAFEDVVYVGGNDVIRKLASKLYDATPASRPAHIPDVILDPPRHVAIIALSRIVDDPSAPKINYKTITFSSQEKNVLKWREWWQANSNKYCNLSSNEVVKAKTP